MSRADSRRAKTSNALRKSCEAGPTMSNSSAPRSGTECSAMCALGMSKMAETPSPGCFRTFGTPMVLNPAALAAAINNPPRSAVSRNCSPETP